MPAPRRLITWLTLAALTALTACAEIETTPAQGSDFELPAGTGAERAAQGLGPELYGPGSTWYAYDPSTHALTPDPVVYVVRGSRAVTLLEILSYYDARGTSGHFTLRARSRVDGVWQDRPRELALARNVKDGTICLDPVALAERDCAFATIALRTVWRPVPGAGFAVQEPALYTRSHYSEPVEDQVDVAALVADSLDEVDVDLVDMSALERLPTSSLTPNDSLIGLMTETPHAYVQLTARMVAAQWRVLERDVSEEGVSVTLGVRCRALSAEALDFPEQEARATLELTRTGGYDVALVQLCGGEGAGAPPAIVSTSAAPVTGLWPDTREFDLLLEHHQGRLAIRAAPGNLVSDETLRAGADGQTPIELAPLLAPADTP